jgi:hypothetical protein
VVDPAIAGLKEGEKRRERAFLALIPRIQIVTQAFVGKFADLSIQAAPNFHVGSYLTRRGNIFSAGVWVASGCYASPCAFDYDEFGRGQVRAR